MRQFLTVEDYEADAQTSFLQGVRLVGNAVRGSAAAAGRRAVQVVGDMGDDFGRGLSRLPTSMLSKRGPVRPSEELLFPPYVFLFHS